MIANSKCLDCCLKSALKKAEAIGLDLQQESILKERLISLAKELEGSESAPSLSALLSDELRPYTDVDGAYSSIKTEFNKLMLSLEDYIYTDILQNADPLARAIQYAMVGNYIDFGAVHNVSVEELRELIDKSASIPLPEGTLEKLRTQLGTAKKLLFISDNCGEIVMDKLLIKTLIATYPELNIQLMVRGKPAQNDATMEDAEQVGLCDMVSVIGNGRHCPGTPIDGRLKVDDEIISLVSRADIVIAKGQGNFETLSGCGWNVYYIFLCKCENFTARFGLKQFSGVLANEYELSL